MSKNLLKTTFLFTIVFSLLLAACGPAATEEPVMTEEPAMTDEPLEGVA